MTSTGLVLDDCFCRHDTGPGHAERPERIRAIATALQESDLIERCRRIEPLPAQKQWVLNNHTEDYFERLQVACQAGEQFIDTPDSIICPASFEIALLATGAVVKAVDAVARGELANAFCVVRPPGHHAERTMSMGFCLFNNIAVAARYLLEEHDVERLLILDWDVHHGNGTQNSFEGDPRVFYCSLHQHPDTLYPGTGYESERGTAAGEGSTLNLPMMPGSGDAEYRSAFEQMFRPAAREFGPQFVLISAGFDAHRADPLAQINLESASFEWLTRETLALADELCEGRYVSVLEGGYDLDALAESAAVHVDCLAAD